MRISSIKGVNLPLLEFGEFRLKKRSGRDDASYIFEMNAKLKI